MCQISGLDRFFTWPGGVTQINTYTNIQVKFGISPTGCSPHVDFDYTQKSILFRKMLDIRIYNLYPQSQKNMVQSSVSILLQIYNLLFGKFFLVNFTRRIRMSDEFRLMNSLDNLIRVRIYYWKHVLVDGTSLTMTSEGGGGR